MFRPMLACPLLHSDIECNDDTVFAAMKKLHYPVMATVKMDGIRALRMEDIYLASRTLKWIPNTELCGRAISLPMGYDMELWSPKLDYNDIQSIVMTENADASAIQFHVLDNFNYFDLNYQSRCVLLFKDCYASKHQSDMIFEQPVTCDDPEELFAFERFCIEQHSEGICFRLQNSPYKHGRSTLQEQYLVKHCRWIYEECRIVGFKEQMFNGNDVKRNAIDKMDRSKSLEGMRGKDTLGAFTVINKHGVEFDVGSGNNLTNEKRKYIWAYKLTFLGKEIIVKSKAHGVKNKPRSPVFWGFRDKGF